MSQTGSPVSDGTGLAAAFAAWAGLPSLAPALKAADTIHLVVDPGDGRILHASPAAAPLAAALAASDGAALARQIAQAGAEDAAPRLVRLRLDPRRIAPPALCLLARGTRADGAPVVLVVPTAPVALPRTRPARRSEQAPQSEQEGTGPLTEPPEAEPVPPVPPGPKAGDRFVWRSDAAGTLVALTGAARLAGLVGRDWRDVARPGPLGDAGSVLAALGERRTFRAAPITIDVGDGPIAVELSGAPLGRGDATFPGFGGFGVIRGVPDRTRPESATAPPPASGARAPGTAGGHEDAPTPVADRTTTAPDAERGAAAPAEPTAAFVPVAALATDAAITPTPTPIPASSPAAEAPSAPAPADASLSTDEHAAFREIARALGARYAGDEQAAGAASAPPRPASGAVMPFPALHAEPPQTTLPSVDPAARRDADLLAGLPVPALVHRGEAILAANPALLDLAGFPDLAALNAAGLARLFRGLPPDGAHDASGRRTAIETADGRARPVEMMRGTCTWAGAPAACLILRPLGEDDTAPALAAERLARAAQAARATGAEAALDALEAGVVTVDAAGRVVALNRAAVALFGCDPREVVGGSFVGLFDARSALCVTEALRGATEAPRGVSASGRSLMLDLSPARADGRRVAVLNRAPPAEPASVEALAVPNAGPDGPAEPVHDRAGFLRRLDLSLRGPASGIVDLIEAVLREPFGPLGDPRYRHGLVEIRDAAERLRERVCELLDIAAVEAGTLDLDLRPIALNEVVAACVARLQQEAARGRIVLRTSFSADLTELEADERTIGRAACLVIEHAIRRSSAGGQVIVSTGTAESAQIALRVRDTGAGKPESGAAGPQEPGDDLALPRALVEANGGSLRLAHRADEDGTLVEIILPARRVAGA